MRNILPEHVIEHFLKVENKDETVFYFVYSFPFTCARTHAHRHPHTHCNLPSYRGISDSALKVIMKYINKSSFLSVYILKEKIDINMLDISTCNNINALNIITYCIQTL